MTPAQTATVLRAVRREVTTCIQLLTQQTRRDPRADGQLEAFRHLATVIAARTPRMRTRRRR